MIPKIIHYCWFGKNPIPEDAKKCIESWKAYCPDYQIMQWDEDNFDLNCNDYVREAYECKKWAFITDYVRLFAIYNYGGVYMDTDVELLKNIDGFLSASAFTGFEDNKYPITGILAGEKHSQLFEYLLSYYNDKHFLLPDGSMNLKTNVVTITEMLSSKYNVKLDNSFQKFEDGFELYPSDFFCPKSHLTGKITLTDNTVCIHHFSGTWHSEEEKAADELKKKFSNICNCELSVYLAQIIIWIKYRGLIGTIKKIFKKREK